MAVECLPRTGWILEDNWESDGECVFPTRAPWIQGGPLQAKPSVFPREIDTPTLPDNRAREWKFCYLLFHHSEPWPFPGDCRGRECIESWSFSKKTGKGGNPPTAGTVQLPRGLSLCDETDWETFSPALLQDVQLASLLLRKDSFITTVDPTTRAISSAFLWMRPTL